MNIMSLACAVLVLVLLDNVASAPTSKSQLGHTFRQSCSRIIDSVRVDPIVAPNANSTHAHTVAGGGLFNPSIFVTKPTSAVPCTSCSVIGDKSLYWYPSLFYQVSKGRFEYIPASVTTYYEVRGKVYNLEFPSGFAYIAGSAKRRTLDPSIQEQLAVQWLCLNGSSQPQGQGLPQGCRSDIRAQIQFPVCNDGRSYSADGSHMAYAYNNVGTPKQKIAFDGGDCPASHPIRFVKLFVEVYFAVGQNYPLTPGYPDQRFVLSNGDPTGYSFHLDFINRWDKGVLQTIIDTCDYGSGFGFFDPSNCPYIKKYQFQVDTVKNQCRVTDPSMMSHQETVYITANNNVKSFLTDRLPGCNPVSTLPPVPNNCTAPYIHTPTI